MQHVNVLNHEECDAVLTAAVQDMGQPAVDWVLSAVKKALRISGDNAEYLGLKTMFPLTPREALLFVNFKPTIQVFVLSREQMKTPWIKRALDEGEVLVHYALEGFDGGRLRHLIEAMREMYGILSDYRHITFSAARQCAKDWQARLEREAITREGQIQVVAESGDLQIVELLDKQAFAREGWLMHHCSLSYEPQPWRKVYSVRRQGISLATAELRRYESNDSKGKLAMSLQQIQGPANTKVDDAVRDFFVTWMNQTFCVVSSQLNVYEVGIQATQQYIAGPNQFLSAPGAVRALDVSTWVPQSHALIESLAPVDIELLISKFRQAGAKL